MSLSQEEKEQVAVLLGWVKCDAYHNRTDRAYWKEAAKDPRLQMCQETHEIVTLEACIQFIEGKGWGWTLSGGGSFYHEAGIWPGVRWVYAPESPGALTALVRALLKAEEAAK